MSSHASETTLALYVEGDLDDDEARLVAEHLGGCELCQARVSDLTTSQRQLKSLKSAPLDPAMVERLHTAVMEAVSREEPGRAEVPRWSWALAASVAALAVTGVFLWRATPSAPIAPSRVTRMPASTPSPPAPTRPQEPGLRDTPREETSPREAVLRPPEPRLSTPSSPPPVSEDVDGGASVHRLASEDADRLARALLTVSKIDTLPRLPEDDQSEEPRHVTQVRWTTDDPNVVIYWQMDAGGG